MGASPEGENLPLLAIGRHAKPRCFKNAKLPLKYVSNKKAWMTSDIFKSYMKNLDFEMRQKQRKIAVILDNCSSHRVGDDLTNITVYFLPQNTTSHI